MAAVAPLVDAVVAVDGAYAHFPTGRGRSPADQERALVDACSRHGVDLQTGAHEPGPDPAPWPSEVAKRAYVLELGVLAAEGGWLLVLDADELARSADPAALHMALEIPDLGVDVLTFDLYGEAVGDVPTYRYPSRRLLRALPGLTCVEAHYVAAVWPAEQHNFARYRYLSGHPDWHPLEPTRQISAELLEAEHRHQDRSPARNRDRWEYYRRSNELGLEQIIR